MNALFLAVLIICGVFALSYLLAYLVTKKRKVLYSFVLFPTFWLLLSGLYSHFHEIYFNGNTQLLMAVYIINPWPYIVSAIVLILFAVNAIVIRAKGKN